MPRWDFAPRAANRVKIALRTARRPWGWRIVRHPWIECDGPVRLVLAALLYEVLSVGLAFLLPHATIGVLVRSGRLEGSSSGTLVLWLVGQVVPGYRVEGFGAALLGALMVNAAMCAAGAIFAFVPLLRSTGF